MVRLRKMIKWLLLIQVQIHLMFWVLGDKGNTLEKTHFEILGSTNYDTETLIFLSTKIKKLHYLGFYSSNLKYEYSSRNISINRFHDDKLIFLFWVLQPGIDCDSSSSSRARLRPMTLEKFSKHGFSFFHQILPFSFESWSMWYFGCLIYKILDSTLNNYYKLKWEKF